MELPLHVETAVRQRYSAASKAVEPALCCPVSYDRKFLTVLPEELIERDYGCGDPSRFVSAGETVLDLGSGGGKICYIASQIVGPNGRVIGIDMNEDMLALARKFQREIAERIGWDNVTFHRGRIQDLALSLDQLDEVMQAAGPVKSAQDYLALHRQVELIRRAAPLVPSGSIDVVLSNCVLNLVDEADRGQLFREVYRVLRPGGRAVISDIVSNCQVPAKLKADPTLWSGCISGAFEETEFLRAFSTAGFGPALLVTRQPEPWTVVAGIEFRSVTARAMKDGGLPLTHSLPALAVECGDQGKCC